MQHQYTYAKALAASQRINWRLEDLVGDDKPLDFTRPFLPEPLARTQALGFLSPDEQRKANQIRGYGYLCLFGLVEEFVLPFVLDHARARLRQDDDRVRALLQFAGEEAKHIELFKRFQQDFERGFGTRCDVIGPADAIAREVLRHQPLAVAIAILHIEWMTQRHYLDSVSESGLDPQFKSLLHHHYVEEVQHAKLDMLMVEALAENQSEQEIARAVEEYLEIGVFLDQGLRQQLDLDLAALVRASGRQLSASETERYIAVQQPALRWTFLGSGMTHPQVLATLQALSPQARERIEQVAPAFC